MVLRPLTFKETVNMVRFKVAMLIFIFCLSYLYIIYFFFLLPCSALFSAPSLEDRGQGRLVCCSPWGLKELDMTEH